MNAQRIAVSSMDEDEFEVTDQSFHRFSDFEWKDMGADVDIDGERAIQSAFAWCQQPRVRRIEDAGAKVRVKQLIDLVRAKRRDRKDFEIEDASGDTFRVNQDCVGDGQILTLRRQPGKVPYLENLLLPRWWRELHLNPSLKDGGLILVAGPMGSGKSYTLASAIQTRTRLFGGKALCIADPIELDIEGVHGLGLVRQKEVDYELPIEDQFADALRAVRRQYPAGNAIPKILMIGEIRDKHSAGALIRAANIGCLCYATVHGDSPRNAIASALSFAADDMGEERARDQLGSALRMAMYQRLVRVPGEGDQRRVEGSLLWSSSGSHAVGALVREGKLAQLATTYESQNRALEVKKSWDEVLDALGGR